MTKEEFFKLESESDMWDALWNDKELRSIAEQEGLYEYLGNRIEENEKAARIRHFGYYDPDLSFDPLPRDPNNR